MEIWPTAYELAAGHRLQLRLTSADVPTHAPAYIPVDRNDPASLSVAPVPLAPVRSRSIGKRDDPYYS